MIRKYPKAGLGEGRESSWAEAEVGASPHPEEREDALPTEWSFVERKDGGLMLGKVKCHLPLSIV